MNKLSICNEIVAELWFLSLENDGVLGIKIFQHSIYVENQIGKNSIKHATMELKTRWNQRIFMTHSAAYY